MKNILVAALSLIVFETFGALPAGTVLKFENPDQMMHYIKMQTREVDRLRPGVPQAIVAGIKDHELEKQKQFHDCLNYFSALPSEQCRRFYAESTVEPFDKSVLPRTSQSNISCFCSDIFNEFSQHFFCEFRAIIASDILRNPSC